MAAIALLASGIMYWYMDSREKAEQAHQAQIARQQEQARLEREKAHQAELERQKEQARQEADRMRTDLDSKARAEASRIAAQLAEAERKAKEAEERLAKAPGSIVVSTEPAGAEISVDGGPAQIAPAVRRARSCAPSKSIPRDSSGRSGRRPLV